MSLGNDYRHASQSRDVVNSSHFREVATCTSLAVHGFALAVIASYLGHPEELLPSEGTQTRRDNFELVQINLTV